MDTKPWRYEICQECKAPHVEDFKKVAGLKKSGLLIFVHKENHARSTTQRKDETFILHNASEKELTRTDYIMEMCQYKTKCFQCRTVIHRVRSLLDEITDLKKDEVIGVCEHCKRANPAGNCRRCDYIVKKFLCNKVRMYEDRQARFKTWLSKVNQLLNSILESGNIYKHKLYKESASTAELEKLFQELNTPFEMRQPEITFFPNEKIDSITSLTESKVMLEQLLIKLKSESFNRRSSKDSLFVSTSNTETSCVFKHLRDKKFEGRPPLEVLQETPTRETKPESQLRQLHSGPSVQNEVTLKLHSGPMDQRPMVQKMHSGPMVQKLHSGAMVQKLHSGSMVQNVEISSDKDGHIEKTAKKTPSKEKPKANTTKEKPPGKKNDSPDKAVKESPKKGKAQKPAISSEEAMLLRMIKKRGKERMKNEKAMKAEKAKRFAKIGSLPQLIVREVIEVVEETSESVVECAQEETCHTEMIKGTKIVPFDPNYNDKAPDPLAPLLYRIDAVCPEPDPIVMKPQNISTPTAPINESRKSKSDAAELPTKGIINYKLSNREFIKKGWTILPTAKVMRRMNIYKMEPASPEYNWFERHKNRRMMFYDSGERLAEIDEHGWGKWFYKSGTVALDYYSSQELDAGQRYVVYSSGEEMDNGRNKPVTVLASFDYLGNGVVYDHCGNVRLKYNQTEGMVIDEKIGPPGRWKWHSLNEPPILQPVFIDNYVKHNSSCMKLLLQDQNDNKSAETSRLQREANEEVIAIELENFIKEKANKMLQKYKPFKIRPKALKVNEQFSLRVLDQANIYLLFRDGHVSLKLNLGMMLISSEIVDTDTADVSEVSTPYDRYPPKSQSVADIQYTINKARQVGRNRAPGGKSANMSLTSSCSY